MLAAGLLLAVLIGATGNGPTWLRVAGDAYGVDDGMRFGKGVSLLFALLAFVVGLRWLPAICTACAYAFWWPSPRLLADLLPLPVLLAVALLPVSAIVWVIAWSDDLSFLNAPARALTFLSLVSGSVVGVSLASQAFIDGRWATSALLGVAGVYCGIGVVAAFFLLFGRLAERDSGGAAALGAGCLTLVLFPFWPVLLFRQFGGGDGGHLSADHWAMIERASGAVGLTGQRLAASRRALSSTLDSGESVLSVVLARQGPDIWLTDRRAIFVAGRRVTAERPLASIVATAHVVKGGREKSHWLHIRFDDGTYHDAYFGRDRSDAFAGVTTNESAVSQVVAAVAALDHATGRRTGPGSATRPLPPPQVSGPLPPPQR